VNGPLIAATLICVAVHAGASEPPAGTPVSFLACPVARDTGPDTDVCFYAEHDGNRYGLANPSDWGAPQLKHRVLVEGRVSAGAPYCGAIAIEGRASVMREIDESCAEVVPFDNIVKGAAGGVFNNGTPQQRAFAEDLARRAVANPSLSVEPAIPDPAPSPMPVPPFEPRTLVITYPFDSDRGPGPDMRKLRELVEFVRVAKARSVHVIGYCAISRLSDGSELQEGPEIAQARAIKIAGILNGLGVGSKVIHVRWESRPLAGTGDRKVEVMVTP
jgi:hypothetical protein